MVVVQDSSDALSAADRARRAQRRGTDEQLIGDSLVIPFVVIVRQVLCDGAPKMPLSERDHSIQAFVLDRPHKPLRGGIAVRRPHRSLDDLHAG
jgi:hypothetical protein